ncbi:hypothetical protein C8J57DRAFT_1231451 [Mycena rebaudengoi]|nr:hypothetical protein C8J57DRAFT_1231451 [Mycena rebaudengoi]
MSDNQESLLLPELPAPPTTILVSMGWAMLDYVRAFVYPDGDQVRERIWVRVPVMGVKHGTSEGKKIINMDREDGALVRCEYPPSLLSPVSRGLLWPTNLAALWGAPAATALRLLKERVKCYTLPFFPDGRAWTTFFEALEEFESWINGSVPLEALSLQSRPEVPTNLNVLLSHVHELNWARTMIDVLGFHLDSSVASSGRWYIVGKRYTSFTHQHVPLQQHRNIRVVLAGTHTGQLNTISARELIFFNVHPTAEQTVVEGWRHPGENLDDARRTASEVSVTGSGESSATGVQVVLGGTRGCPEGLSIGQLFKQFASRRKLPFKHVFNYES